MTDALQHISRANREVPGITRYFNWNEISKDVLPSEFIEAHYRQLNWDILCKYQPFDLDIAQKFEYLIKDKLQTLVMNKNLSPEVLRYYINHMDWDSVQTYQKLPVDLLEELRGDLNLLIVLQHQTLPEAFLRSLLQPIIDNKEWSQLRKYLTLVFTYQTVSTQFVVEFLVLEVQINEQADPAEQTGALVVLVDLPTVIRKQTLSDEFIETFCMPVEKAREEVCRSQKLSCAFINTHFDQLHVRRLLKYQELDEPTMVRCIERAITKPKSSDEELQIVQVINQTVQAASGNEEPVAENQASKERRFNVANTLIRNQVYSLDLAKRVIAEFDNCDARWTHMLWGNIFIRSLTPVGDKGYMGFGSESILTQIMPNVNWDMVASCELTKEQTDAVIDLAATEMPWYLFIKNHHLTEEQIEVLCDKKALSPIDWWLLLTNIRPQEHQLTYPFIKKYEDHKRWWLRVRDPAEFYTICLQAIDNLDNLAPDQNIDSRMDLRTFLRDFVRQANWKQILRHETLPEWFIRLFGHQKICKKIDMYWWKISRWQKLSIQFINSNISHLDLQIVLGYQVVPESFIEDKIPFFNKDNWDAVARHQKLSSAFVEKYSEHLDASLLAVNPNM